MNIIIGLSQAGKAMTIYEVFKAVFLNGTNQVCPCLYKVEVLMLNHVQRGKVLGS